MTTHEQQLKSAILAFLVHKKVTQTSKVDLEKIILDIRRMRKVSPDNIKKKIASRSRSTVRKSINAIDFGEGEALLKELEKIIRERGKQK